MAASGQMGSNSPGERVVVFTLHRSGSMVLYRVCRELARRAGYRHYTPNGGDVLVPLRQLAEQPEHWLSRPGCFGPLRIYIPVPHLDASRILLHLRDPRDVLVSMFYSYCYSHPGEVEGGTGVRGEVAERGIDAFVWQLATADTIPVTGDYGTGTGVWNLAGNVRQRYESYVGNLLDRPNTVLVRYEDMVADPRLWVRDVAGAFGLEWPKEIEQIARAVAPQFKVDSEDRWAHKRRVMPGDYKQKLRPETIGRLNDALGTVLARLGYPA